jgi:5-methylcytosine-specific restriction enzyme A
MSLADLTPNSVHRAIAEFDEIGREAFLKRYGYRRSRAYFLVHNGAKYDSKAVAGAAHGHLGGQLNALEPDEFSGGERTVAKRLRELGFTIVGPTEIDEEISFELGMLYNRVQDIHEIYDGQRQGGISTPDGAAYVFLFTGETGEQYGYKDGWRPDGLFAYTGEGQRGDMEFVRGNRAIRDHLANGRDLLLFEATNAKGQYRFRGCFACAGWELKTTPDRDGAERQAIVFHLAPVAEVEMAAIDEQVETELAKKSLKELRQLALAAAHAPPTPPSDGYISKPISPRQLLAKVREYLSRPSGTK